MKQKFRDILEAVRSARNAAEKEARDANPTGHVQSRGVFLSVEMTRDGKTENAFPGEERIWKGTKADIEEGISEARRKFPGWTMVSFSLFGGFDWREKVNAEDYEPLVSEWLTQEFPIDEEVMA